MNFLPFYGFFLTFIQGYFFVSLFLQDPKSTSENIHIEINSNTQNPISQSARWMRFFLALPLGYGLTSIVYFLWRAIFQSTNITYVFFELSVALILFGLYLRQGLSPTLRESHSRYYPALGIWRVLLPATLVLALLGLIIAFVIGSIQFSHGISDAWSIWNLGARYLFRGGANWINIFSNNYSSPEQPLMVGASVARMWTYFEQEIQWAPQLTGLIFASSIIGLVAATTSILRGRYLGILSALAVLSASAIYVFISAQTSDLPFMFFMLSAVLILYLFDIGYTRDHKVLILSGIFAGLAAWTSNSGWIFILSVLFSRIFWLWRKGGKNFNPTTWRNYLLGILPIIMMIIFYRISFFPNAPTYPEVAEFLNRLISLSNLFDVVLSAIYQIFSFQNGFSIPYLALILFLFLTGIRKDSLNIRANRLLRDSTLVYAFLTIFSIMVTVEDPLFDREIMIRRLLFHLWPLMVFFGIMIADLPQLVFRNRKYSDNKIVK